MDTEPEAEKPSDPPKPAAEGDAPSPRQTRPLAALTPTVDAPPVAETAPAPPVEETAPAPPVEDEDAPIAGKKGPHGTDILEPPQGPSGTAKGEGKQAPSEAVIEEGAKETLAVAAGAERQGLSPALEETAPPGDVAEEPKVARPRRRWWLRGLGVFFLLLIAAGAAILVFGPGYARGRIEEEARARGVVLAFGEMDLGLEKIRLHGVRVALAGVRDFEAGAAWIDVAIADGQPTSITAGELSIAMAGTEVLGELGAWKKEHAAALAAPLSGEGAKVEWRPSSSERAALSLSGASVAVDLQKGSIDASWAEITGRGAGPMSLAWASVEDGFVVQITPKLPPLSAAHVEVRSSKDGARMKLTLARTALGPLQDVLGIPKGSEGIQVDGEVEMPVPSLAKPAPVDGTLRLAVKGYTPPHPRELDGILFGDTTTVKSKFQLAADFNGAKLTGITAEAGALSLTGTGEVAREGLDARVSLKLKGSIPCTSLATSAAVARLGSGLGRLAGGLAAGALTGSVGVALTVDARASDIKGAKIKQSASIGCKVSIPGLPTIILK